MDQLPANRRDLIILSCVYIILIMAWILYFVVGREFVSAAFKGELFKLLNIPDFMKDGKTSADFRAGIGDLLILITIISVLTTLVWVLRKSLTGLIMTLTGTRTVDELRPKIFSLLVYLGCCWACFYCLVNQSIEGSWYIIDDLISFKGQSPFQQRVLFLLPASLLKSITRGLQPDQYFYLSQILPICLAFYMIKKWAELFISKTHSYIARPILLAMLVPTIYYMNFYDFGIVFFFTICLYLLFTGRPTAYLIFYALGVLNHEVMLFSVFFFAAVQIGKKSRWHAVAGSVLIQIAIFIILRLITFKFLPSSEIVEHGKIWSNLFMIAPIPTGIGNTLITLCLWYGLALLGLKSAPRELRLCLLMLPVFVVIMLIFGKLNEVRLFNPFIPVAIGLLMCFLKTLCERKPDFV